MKKTLLVGLVILSVFVCIIVWLNLRTSKPIEGTQTQVTFPNTQFTETNEISIKNRVGEDLNAKNFLMASDTKEDSVNKGYYFLGNQPGVPSDYVIEYIAETNYFNISLLKEPLSQSRLKAESYLLNQLGVTKEQLCTLDYMLTVPDFVNSIYSDENLGFSFCPGAVTLP